MGETASNEKAPKTDFIKGLKAEFNKIIWPDKDTLTKETVVVVVSTVILGIVIAALDLIIKLVSILYLVKDEVKICQKHNGMLYTLIPDMRIR